MKRARRARLFKTKLLTVGMLLARSIGFVVSSFLMFFFLRFCVRVGLEEEVK